MPVQIEGGEDYKEKYRTLKKKLKLLIYENECFQEELRKAQRALLKVRRDKSFLLDRLLQYHRGPDSSSDSEQTDDSDPDNDSKTDAKRKRLCPEGTSSTSASHQSSSSSSKPSSSKKKKSISSSGSSKGSSTPSSSSRPKQMPTATQSSSGGGGGGSGGSVNRRLANLASNKPATSNTGCTLTEGQMTREEIERQLAARESINDFTTVSLTVPTQMFSMEGDLMEEEIETSPSNMEEEVTVDSYE